MTPLLFLLAISAANPVFVAAANGNVQSGKYVVEIRGETPVDPNQVTARLSGDVLTLYVAGGKVRPDNRAWGQGGQRINAHRHVGNIEIEAPLPAKDCSASVNIAAAGQGAVVASVICPTLKTAGLSGPANAAAPTAKPVAAKTPVIPMAAAIVLPSPAPVKTPVEAKAVAPSAHDADALLAAVALVPPEAAPTVVQMNPSAPIKLANANVEPVRQPVTMATKAQDQPPPTQTSLWGAAVKALVPVLLLAALGIVGLRFAKKRRGIGRHVQILETTALGPKRSLIVAKVGGETLLLGASEAGISLIQVRPSALSQDEDSRRDTDEHIDISPKWADVLPADFSAKPANDEDGGQAKMLSRLFKKRRQEIPDAWPFANVLDASLLEESIEDRELRDKLAMGMEARVP